MSKIILPSIGSGYASVEKLNNALQQIEDELNNKVLYRDNPEGQDNTIKHDIDMDGHNILNVEKVDANEVWVGGKPITADILTPSGELSNTLDLTSSETLTTKSLGDWAELLATPENIEVAAGAGVKRSLADRFADVVNVKDFEYLVEGNNWTDAFVAASAHAKLTGKKYVYGPSGVYRISQVAFDEGIGFVGDGMPIINTWFNTVGDKPLLRPGYKDKMSGTVILLVGSPTDSYITNRTDKFSSILYGLKYAHKTAAEFRDFGVVMDMDVYDAAGNLTTEITDNRSGHECGLLIRSPLVKISNVCSFGYFTKGGLTIHSQESLETIDTDYIRVFQSDITSTVLIANNNADTQGLTGTRFTDCGFYNAADHHNAVGGDGDYTLNAIYVDGDNGIAGIRGHSFSGNMRTRANDAISLDHCNDVCFDLTVETPILPGVTGADTQGNIVGTVNTGNIRLINVGQSSVNGLGINGLAETISGTLISLGGESNDEIIISKAGNSIRLTGGADGVIQITDDLGDLDSKWTIRKDTSQSDLLSIRYDGVECFRIEADGTVRTRSGLDVDAGINVTDSISTDNGEMDIRAEALNAVRLRSGPKTVLFVDESIIRSGSNGVVDLGSNTAYFNGTYTESIITKSPDGTEWELTIDNSGNLVITGV